MKEIQIDAFEVQLGAGVLIQCQGPDGSPITILADAGVKAKEYPVDHIHGKLPDAFDRFRRGHRRIDLIVGTHYDADHLRGLVPIIADSGIEIGEIWLPPVADDQAPNPMGSDLRDSQFLALKWRGEGQKDAHAYLHVCAERCEELRKLERQALISTKERPAGMSWNPERRTAVLSGTLNLPGKQDPSDFAFYRGVFEAHFDECSSLPGQEPCTCHADESIGFSEVYPDAVFSLDDFDPQYRQQLWNSNPSLAATHSLDYARLRKAVAADAITASHLAEILHAIDQRDPNLPVKCRVIPDGKPVGLRWSQRAMKFLPGAPPENGAPSITLLGPSESLVKKHRDKLPVIEQTNLLFLSRIPIKGITPNNQLSSIFRIDHASQRVLITGDAGCVDYQPGRNQPYYPALLREFSDLHVIQVAHHAGYNAHFYRVLLESGFKGQDSRSFLILSHATNDKSRPSEEFAQFIGEARSNKLDLLFTSRPAKDKVEGFEDLIYAAVGDVEDVGDIRLSFANSQWTVDSHAIVI